jgi:phage terminase large subunit-like protein
MRETGIYITWKTYKRPTDKILFAQPIVARMRTGSILFEKEADWYPGFEGELTRFPRGQHDDQVDAFSLIGQHLNFLAKGDTKEELEQEKYEEEREESQMNEQGRSMFTGY